MTEVNGISRNVVEVEDKNDALESGAEIDLGDGVGEIKDCIHEGEDVLLEDDDNDDYDMPLVPKIEKEVGFIIMGLRGISSGFVRIVRGVERIVRAIFRAVKELF